MAGSGVAAVFNWGSPSISSTPSAGLGSWGGGAGGSSAFGDGSGLGIGSSGFASTSSYAGPASLISDTGVYKTNCTSVR